MKKYNGYETANDESVKLQIFEVLLLFKSTYEFVQSLFVRNCTTYTKDIDEKSEENVPTPTHRNNSFKAYQHRL